MRAPKQTQFNPFTTTISNEPLRKRHKKIVVVCILLIAAVVFVAFAFFPGINVEHPKNASQDTSLTSMITTASPTYSDESVLPTPREAANTTVTTTSTNEGTTIPNEITVGSIVTINEDAVYGGLGSARGKSVPASMLAPIKHTVSEIEFHNGEGEALLSEIHSWVALRYLLSVE